MIKILANDGIDADGQMLLEEAGYHVDTEKIPQEDLPKVLPNYDVVIVRSATKIRKDLIDLCPNLKIIARGGVGLDNIDAEYAESKGIAVMNTPAASSQSVAELVFAHIFTLARFLQQSNHDMRSKGNTEFKKLKSTYSDGIQVRSKVLGIIGFGRIGQEVARIGVALGMKVMPVDLVVEEAEIDINVFDNENVKLSVRLETYEWEEVLKTSDFLTLHVPFSGGSALIGEKEIGMMKDGAIIINAARGGAIDEQALLDALNSGKLRGAALDVFDNEPTPRMDLITHPRVSVTPHIGAATQEAQSLIGLELADRILAFFGDDK
ncbi:MAG: D-2-hydroxyacid dehydrogenase [Phaeodactylibacter sp.]|nr:D-2-hydroxyacid dehydrogenase [Phaeodactylibacter sp.]MCB9302556.1 D-2-hydroxyacid dehydrogenase [Lewinellaceae bacterium]